MSRKKLQKKLFLPLLSIKDLLVFFDLPTLTKQDRKNASCFRRFLLNDGYFMLQLSVYLRVCKDLAEVNTHI